MAKWFSGNEFANTANVARCSFFALAAIADNVIVVLPAAPLPGCDRGARPTAAISGARKAGSIIVTGSGSTVIAGLNRA